jgi:hypothetical protein
MSTFHYIEGHKTTDEGDVPMIIISKEVPSAADSDEVNLPVPSGVVIGFMWEFTDEIQHLLNEVDEFDKDTYIGMKKAELQKFFGNLMVEAHQIIHRKIHDPALMHLPLLIGQTDLRYSVSSIRDLARELHIPFRKGNYLFEKKDVIRASIEIILSAQLEFHEEMMAQVGSN